MGLLSVKLWLILSNNNCRDHSASNNAVSARSVFLLPCNFSQQPSQLHVYSIEIGMISSFLTTLSEKLSYTYSVLGKCIRGFTGGKRVPYEIVPKIEVLSNAIMYKVLQKETG